ncbi:hypothetical protein RB195_018309 [Necator americanus]|uniref:Uncharacterized protein n=1 Tax=Necator americanus TaxID=51031 RepID=A0ABR1CC63_NECAM
MADNFDFVVPRPQSNLYSSSEQQKLPDPHTRKPIADCPLSIIRSELHPCAHLFWITTRKSKRSRSDHQNSLLLSIKGKIIVSFVAHQTLPGFYIQSTQLPHLIEDYLLDNFSQQTAASTSIDDYSSNAKFIRNSASKLAVAEGREIKNARRAETLAPSS